MPTERLQNLCFKQGWPLGQSELKGEHKTRTFDDDVTVNHMWSGCFGKPWDDHLVTTFYPPKWQKWPRNQNRLIEIHELNLQKTAFSTYWIYRITIYLLELERMYFCHRKHWYIPNPFLDIWCPPPLRPESCRSRLYGPLTVKWMGTSRIGSFAFCIWIFLPFLWPWLIQIWFESARHQMNGELAAEKVEN